MGYAQKSWAPGNWDSFLVLGRCSKESYLIFQVSTYFVTGERCFLLLFPISSQLKKDKQYCKIVLGSL